MFERKLLVVAIGAALFVGAAGATSAHEAGRTIESASSAPATVILARADDPPGDMRRGRGRDDAAPHARNGADNPPGDARRGRGGDDGAGHKRQGADDLPGDVRRGRGGDDGAGHKRQGADDPAGDDRRNRGRGRDDPPNHG